MALLSASCQQVPTDSMLIVGTYTDTSSQGIYAFNYNQKTYDSELLNTIYDENPSFLNIDFKTGQMLSVKENGAKTAALMSYELDTKTGAMTKTAETLTQGAHSCHVSRYGQTAYVANYTGGTLSVLNLDEEGKVLDLAMQIPGETFKADPVREATPHVHCSMVEPDHKHLLFSDFSADRLARVELDGKGMPIASTIQYASLSPSTGVRHITLSNDGRLAYVIGELSEAVGVIELSSMKVLQEIQAHEKLGRQAGDIHLTPNGKFLYASIRNMDDGIAIFKVGKDGLLEKTGYQTTGIHPRNFTINPSGTILLCACRDSDSIETYAIDQKTGALTLIPEATISVPHPVYVQFSK